MPFRRKRVGRRRARRTRRRYVRRRLRRYRRRMKRHVTRYMYPIGKGGLFPERIRIKYLCTNQFQTGGTMTIGDSGFYTAKLYTFCPNSIHDPWQSHDAEQPVYYYQYLANIYQFYYVTAFKINSMVVNNSVSTPIRVNHWITDLAAPTGTASPPYGLLNNWDWLSQQRNSYNKYHDVEVSGRNVRVFKCRYRVKSISPNVEYDDMTAASSADPVHQIYHHISIMNMDMSTGVYSVTVMQKIWFWVTLFGALTNPPGVNVTS